MYPSRGPLLINQTIERYGKFHTVQELLDHSDVSVTMIYTHVLNRGGRDVKSPADRLGFDD